MEEKNYLNHMSRVVWLVGVLRRSSWRFLRTL